MRVLIAAGGTAGHINPALAIAGALKKADPTAEIHFAGRKEGMEYRLVTQAGYPFHHIEITGFQRKLSLHNIKRNLITLWNLALSGPKAKAMMKEVKPDLVIGCGGYVSGPVVRCAAKMGIHTAIHEQNAFPGVTNKLLAPDVDLVFAAVPAAVEKLGAPDKTIVVGNPVRPEVFTKATVLSARSPLIRCFKMAVFSFTSSCVYVPFNNASASLIPCCSASKLSFVYPSEEIAFAVLMTSFSSDISTVTFWRFSLAASTSAALSFISDVQVSSSGFFKSSVALFTTS